MVSADSIHEIMNQAIGTDSYYRLSSFCRNIVATDSIIATFEHANCFWIGDVLASHYGKLKRCDETRLFVLTITVKQDHSCMYKVTRERYNEVKDKYFKQTVFSQKIPFTDLPIGEYEFWIGIQPLDAEWNECYYVLMNKGDY